MQTVTSKALWLPLATMLLTGASDPRKDGCAQVGPVGTALGELSAPVLVAQRIECFERVGNLAKHHQGPGCRELAVAGGQGLVALVHT